MTRADSGYEGRRVAGRASEPATTLESGATDESLAPVGSVEAPEAQLVLRPVVRPAPEPVVRPLGEPVRTGRETLTPTTGTHYAGDRDLTAEPPLVESRAAGRRRAVRHSGSRGPLFRGLPSAPVALGLATLAVAVGGALHATEPDLAGASAATASSVRPASALSGTSGVSRVDTLRGTNLSRSSDRQTLEQAADSELVAAAEAQAEERNAALGNLAAAAEKQAQKLESNQWVLPLQPSIITATFGEYGLWASYHTGLDFNGETGDPIHAIAGGVVTSVGYDGAYGNKTVVTLEDGTELWYCHQTTTYVTAGDVVAPDEVIGTVGTTGNVTGSHLHVEVRPGGGDPVDPYAAFVVHGVTP